MKNICLKIYKFNQRHDLFSLFMGLYFVIYLPIVSLATIVNVPSVVTKTLLIFVVAVLFFGLPGFFKRFVFADLFTVGLFFVSSVFSLIVFKNNYGEVLAGLKIFFTSLWIYYLIFRFCQENQKRINVITFGSILNLIVLFFVALVHLKTNKHENMTLCYESLFFASICLTYAFFQRTICFKTIVLALSALLGFVTIYIFGSRGPLLFFLLLLLANIYLKIRNKKYKNLFVIIGASLVVVGCVIPFVCMMTYDVDNKIAINVLKFYGKVFSLSGRDYLYALEMNGFRYSPLIGHGLFGDRFLSIGFIFSNPQTTNFASVPLNPYTTYSHNILIEMLLSIGLPLLLLLLFFSLVFFAKYLLPAIKNGNINTVLTLPLLVTGLCSLLLSNSFAVSNYFWCFLGYCVFLYSNSDYREFNEIGFVLNGYHHFEMTV